MSKSSDYYISAVSKDIKGRVTHVMLHEVTDDTSFRNGIKRDKEVVIQYIKKGYIIKTVTWNYPTWIIGARVTYETVNNVEYLRTVPDASVHNNLDNSFPLDSIS